MLRTSPLIVALALFGVVSPGWSLAQTATLVPSAKTLDLARRYAELSNALEKTQNTFDAFVKSDPTNQFMVVLDQAVKETLAEAKPEYV